MSAKDLLYGWTPGAQPFAERLRSVPGIQKVRVGPIVTLDRRPFTCIPDDRSTRLTVRYLGHDADQIIFLDRYPDADPFMLTVVIRRLWEEYCSTSRPETPASDPRKEPAMPIVTRDDVHPDTVEVARLLETLPSVRSAAIGAVKPRQGRSLIHEPQAVNPGEGAKKVLVICPVPGGVEEIFLIPWDVRTLDVTFNDAVALLDGGAEQPRDGPPPATRKERQSSEPNEITEAELLRQKIERLSCIESATLEPPTARENPGTVYPPSVKQWHRGDNHLTVVLYTETHSHKIHVHPLATNDLEFVHEQVRAVVAGTNDLPKSGPLSDDDGPPDPPEPTSPEGTDDMAKSPTEVSLTPKEAGVYEYLRKITGNNPDPDLQRKAAKKFGKSVVNQWYALRKAGLVEKTPNGYLVHKTKVTIKQRGEVVAKQAKAKAGKKRAKREAGPKKHGKTVSGNVNMRLQAAVAFFNAHPGLAELVTAASGHQSFLEDQGWELVGSPGSQTLKPKE